MRRCGIREWRLVPTGGKRTGGRLNAILGEVASVLGQRPAPASAFAENDTNDAGRTTTAKLFENDDAPNSCRNLISWQIKRASRLVVECGLDISPIRGDWERLRKNVFYKTRTSEMPSSSSHCPLTMSVPASILIIGAGEFGIATARALIHDPKYSHSQITMVDASAELSNPAGSSVDASRIVRADYASLPYAKLGLEAQRRWRDTSDAGWGGQGRYHEPGIVLTAHTGRGWYVQNSLENVRTLAMSGLEGVDIKKIEELADHAAIRRATRHSGVSGDMGYVNWGAGWADAEAVMRYVIASVRRESQGRLEVRGGAKVRSLLFEQRYNDRNGRSRCVGAMLEDGSQVSADFVILAAGAWTPSLIDLGGRAIATGQTLAYLPLTDDEARRLGSAPTIFNMTTGMFIMPPRGRELKVARHGYGYRNLKKTSFADAAVENDVSVPEVGLRIPVEAEQLCRKALVEMIPELGDREFSRTRMCWYCDT